MRLIFVVTMCVIAVESSAQETTMTLLEKEVVLSEKYEGESSSLIKILENQTGYLISYSNRVYATSYLSLNFTKGPLRMFLDAIFSRYPVDYITQGKNKIIVAPQQTRYYTLCGFCRDEQTGESLIGANVYDSLLMVGRSTNGYGFFSMRLPEGKVPLSASYVGYRTKTRMVDLVSDTTLNISLQSMLMMEDIEVIATEKVSNEEIGVVDLPISHVKNMPSLLGESDVIRAFQMTPGVQSGEEGFGGMSVRGGSSDQNILLLDDVPMYSSSHLMGLYSIFNIESVNHAKLVKCGFPARFGGRLSSVVDIKTKEGNLQRYGGYVNIGLLSSNATLEGPIIKDKMSFIVSGRRTYFDLFSAKIQNKNDNKYSYYFYDVTAKLNYIPTSRDRLYINFLAGYDHFDYGYNYHNIKLKYDNNEERIVAVSDNQKIKWGSLVSSFRWNHVFGNSMFMNYTAFLSRYRFRNNMIANEGQNLYGYTHKYFSGVQDIGSRLDFTWYMPVVSNVMRFGANITYHTYTPSVTIMSVSDNPSAVEVNKHSQRKMTSAEYHAYCENEFRYEKLHGNVGLHLSGFKRKERGSTVRIEPRLSLGYDFTKWLTTKVSYSDMTQFLQLARIASVASPADIWMPISSKLSIPRAWQFSGEGLIRIGEKHSLTVEVYHKEYVHAQTYKSSSLMAIIDLESWDDLFVEGEGYSNGIELFLHREVGRITGWLGYSWSKSQNKFSEINKGNAFPSDNDRTHSIVFNGSYRLTDNMDFGVAWNYNTGAPVTISDSRYVIYGDDIKNNMSIVSIEGDRNGYRMPSSHTLSLGFNIRKQRERTSSILSFGVYNVYSQKNPMFVYWKQNTDNVEPQNAQFELKQFSLIAWPWPYLRYSIKF